MGPTRVGAELLLVHRQKQMRRVRVGVPLDPLKLKGP
jgi:hypothetical protein